MHTAWRAGSGPAEAARQAGMWGREREGESASYPELNIAAEYRKRMAFSITIGEAALMKRAYIGIPREAALRKSTANRKKRSLFVGYLVNADSLASCA